MGKGGRQRGKIRQEEGGRRGEMRDREDEEKKRKRREGEGSKPKTQAVTIKDPGRRIPCLLAWFIFLLFLFSLVYNFFLWGILSGSF